MTSRAPQVHRLTVNQARERLRGILANINQTRDRYIITDPDGEDLAVIISVAEWQELTRAVKSHSPELDGSSGL